MSDVALRQATSEDMPAIVALLAAVHLPPNELELHIENVVVGEADGRIVACGGLEAYVDDRAGLVRSMAVDESLRGSSVGTQVLEWVFDRAAELGLTDLFLFTMNAQGFYARFGFESCSLDAFPEGARHSMQYRFVEANGEKWGIAAMALPLR